MISETPATPAACSAATEPRSRYWISSGPCGPVGSSRSPGTKGSPLGPRRWDSGLLRPPFLPGPPGRGDGRPPGRASSPGPPIAPGLPGAHPCREPPRPCREPPRPCPGRRATLAGRHRRALAGKRDVPARGSGRDLRRRRRDRPGRAAAGLPALGAVRAATLAAGLRAAGFALRAFGRESFFRAGAGFVFFSCCGRHRLSSLLECLKEGTRRGPRSGQDGAPPAPGGANSRAV